MEKITLSEFEPIFCQQFGIDSNDWLRTPLSRNLSIENMMQKFDTVAHQLFGANSVIYSPNELREIIDNKHLQYRNFGVLKEKLFEFTTFSCTAPDERLNTAIFEDEIADYMEAVRTGIFLAKGITDNVYAYVTLPDMGLTPPDVTKVAIEVAKVFYGETIKPDYFDYYLGKHNWKKMTGETLAAECLNAAVKHARDRRKS